MDKKEHLINIRQQLVRYVDELVTNLYISGTPANFKEIDGELREAILKIDNARSILETMKNEYEDFDDYENLGCSFCEGDEPFLICDDRKKYGLVIWGENLLVEDQNNGEVLKSKEMNYCPACGCRLRKMPKMPKDLLEE